MVHVFCVCAQSLSHVRLFVTPWTVACEAPLSMGYFQWGYWTGLPFPPLGDLPNPGIKPASPASLALQADSLPLSHQGIPHVFNILFKKPFPAPRLWKYLPTLSSRSCLCFPCIHVHCGASQVVWVIKYPHANARDIRDAGSILGLGRFPGEGHGNPLQYSHLENSMDTGVWNATAHGVTKSWTRWSD